MGPEVIAGSTRLKAGTAQKLALNAFSTALMVRRGRTYGNLMSSMRVANAKLRERAVRICCLAAGCDDERARAALAAAGDEIEVALVMLLAGVDGAQARERLAVAGSVREAGAMRLGVAAALVDGELCRATSRSTTAWSRPSGSAAAAGAASPRPGFVDLQVNGFARRRPPWRADPDGYARAGEALLATGVDRLPADVHHRAGGRPRSRRCAAMPHRGLRPARASARTSKARSCRRGGSARTTRQGCSAPDLALLRRLLEAGPVSQVTLAPELPGAFELIDELVARGVTVSCGHTDATAAEAHLAFDRGVRTVTHLFNAMRPSTARDPGIAMAALARADVTVQVIVDGHHLAPRHRARRLAGGRPGASRWSPTRWPRRAWATARSCSAGREVTAEGGVVRRRRRDARGQRADDDRGRAQPARARSRARGRAGGGEHGAGAVVGRADLGRLAVGAPADVVVLDDRLEVQRVLVAGGEHVAR